MNPLSRGNGNIKADILISCGTNTRRCFLFSFSLNTSIIHEGSCCIPGTKIILVLNILRSLLNTLNIKGMNILHTIYLSGFLAPRNTLPLFYDFRRIKVIPIGIILNRKVVTILRNVRCKVGLLVGLIVGIFEILV